jgi:hypothetical protein
MAEAATVGFIVFTLFAVAQAVNTKRTRWYLLAGVFAALANATYLSTVVFVVGLSAALYLKSFDWPPSLSVGKLLPDRHWWAFSSLPGIFGLFYLRYGPLLNDLPDNYSAPLFANEYTLLGKIARYPAYTFFDFWWHTRGFDNESGIIRIIANVKGLFGSLFPVYFIMWSLITVTLTTFIVFGLIRLSRQRGIVSRFMFFWAVLYIIVKLVENGGFTGTYQTRHLIPVFPAFVVAFGVGVTGLIKQTEKQRLNAHIGFAADIETRLHSGIQLRTVLTLILIVGLVGLCVNATANGALRPDHKVEHTTAIALESQVNEDDIVATTDYTGYAEIMVYTHGRIIPRVLQDPGGDLGAYERPGPLRGVVFTTPETLVNTSIDYFVVQTTCHEFNQRSRSYLSAAERIGETTYNKTFRDPGGCTSHAKIVKLG